MKKEIIGILLVIIGVGIGVSMIVSLPTQEFYKEVGTGYDQVLVRKMIEKAMK